MAMPPNPSQDNCCCHALTCQRSRALKSIAVRIDAAVVVEGTLDAAIVAQQQYLLRLRRLEHPVIAEFFLHPLDHLAGRELLAAIQAQLHALFMPQAALGLQLGSKIKSWIMRD